ncbi:MAG: hypothetical protein PHP53_18875 [Prolixibacteraceae bacterium]|nr:hypothetical protein [Prolixibacteraceae bacterium]
MNSERKNIRIVLILLAGLVILLHSIVSHHHHSDLFSDNSSVFNANQIPGESSDEANKHCHAFNNIITEKVTSKTFDTRIESNFNLIFVSVFGIFLSINKVEQNTFFIQNIVIIKQYFRTVQSFRGPPALA